MNSVGQSKFLNEDNYSTADCADPAKRKTTEGGETLVDANKVDANKKAKKFIGDSCGCSSNPSNLIALFAAASVISSTAEVEITQEQADKFLEPSLKNLAESLAMKDQEATSALLKNQALQACLNQPITEYRGKTALCIAVQFLNLSGIKMLLEAGADVNQPDQDGYHPLVRLVTKSNEGNQDICQRIFRLLLEHKVDLNAPMPTWQALEYSEIKTVGQYINLSEKKPYLIKPPNRKPSANVCVKSIDQGKSNASSIAASSSITASDINRLLNLINDSRRSGGITRKDKNEQQALEGRLKAEFSRGVFTPKNIAIRPSHLALYSVIEAIGKAHASLPAENSRKQQSGEASLVVKDSPEKVRETWLPLVPNILKIYNINEFNDRLPLEFWEAVINTQCPELLEILLNEIKLDLTVHEDLMKKCMSSNQSGSLFAVLRDAHGKIQKEPTIKKSSSKPAESLELRLLDHALQIEQLASQWDHWSREGMFTNEHLMALMIQLAQSPEHLDKACLKTSKTQEGKATIANQLLNLCLALKCLPWNALTLKNLLAWSLRNQQSALFETIIKLCAQQPDEVQLEVLEKVVKENHSQLIDRTFPPLGTPLMSYRGDAEEVLQWLNGRSLKQLKPAALASFLKHLAQVADVAMLDEDDDESLMWWALEENLDRVVLGMADKESPWLAELQEPDPTGFTPFQALIAKGNIELALKLAQVPGFHLTAMDCDAALGQGEHYESWKALYRVEVQTPPENPLAQYLRATNHEEFAYRLALSQSKNFEKKLAILGGSPLNVALRDLSHTWAYEPVMPALLESLVESKLIKYRERYHPQSTTKPVAAESQFAAFNEVTHGLNALNLNAEKTPIANRQNPLGNQELSEQEKLARLVQDQTGWGRNSKAVLQDELGLEKKLSLTDSSANSQPPLTNDRQVLIDDLKQARQAFADLIAQFEPSKKTGLEAAAQGEQTNSLRGRANFERAKKYLDQAIAELTVS